MNEPRFTDFQKAFLELKGSMTIQEFSGLLGMSRQRVGFYSHGDRVPDAIGVRTIAKKCNVSADWLLGLSDQKNPDATIQVICDQTGLSDDFVSWLEFNKEYAPQIEKLSKLMIENGFIGGDNSEQE